jgi:hypothetical protein
MNPRGTNALLWRGPATILVALWGLAGCSTAGQDLSEFGNSLTPLTPSEAARRMVDPHDPDNRRTGTVLIANSPFGGADAYIAVYRDRVAREADPLVKAVSIMALGRYGVPDDAPAIAATLEDEQFQVRWEAAKALQRIHNPAVVARRPRSLWGSIPRIASSRDSSGRWTPGSSPSTRRPGGRCRR